MPTRALIVVEGVQDMAVVERLLQADFTRITESRLVPDSWQRFCRGGTNQTSGDAHSLPRQRFLGSNNPTDDRMVMIRVAGSDNAIPIRLAGDLKELIADWPTSVGVLIDADHQAPPDRITWLNSSLADESRKNGRRILTFPSAPGEIGDSGGCRCGVYVLPDNQSRGGLEQLLLEGGTRNFPSLLSKSTSFVRGIEETDVPRDQDGKDKPWKELNKWDRSKAIIHATGAILKPTRPTHATLEDDAWFEGTGLPLIGGLRRFLRELVA